MSDNVEFCVVLLFRFLNPLLMGPAHDWAKENTPEEMPPGIIRIRNFHIAPDRGLAIAWFDTQENLDAATPFFKGMQQQIAERFEARVFCKRALRAPRWTLGISHQKAIKSLHT